jgi:hypothetical protein
MWRPFALRGMCRTVGAALFRCIGAILTLFVGIFGIVLLKLVRLGVQYK